MQKLNIPLIALAIFSIALLLSFDYHKTVYADTEIYNESGGASAYVLRQGDTVNEDRLFAGEKFTSSSSLLGVEFNRVSLEMLETQTPEGTVIIGLWNTTIAPTATNHICFIASFDASIIRFQPSYQFTQNFTKFSGSCTIEANTALGIYYGAGGSTTETITIRRSTSDVFDGTNSHATSYDHVTPAWNDITASDINMRVYLTESSPASQVCIDTSLNGIADFCFGDTNNDGVADNGAGGLLNIATPNQNVTQVAGTFGCGLGLSSCENLEIKTNGIGYLLMALMLVFFAGLMMFFAHKTDTPFNEIHIIFWIVLVLAVTGASYQLNFTDGVPFFATIVAIAGFAGIKMAGYFKGG